MFSIHLHVSLLFFLVLSAINEDSPTVPGLLTDYILKGKFDQYLITYKCCQVGCKI